MTKIRVCIVDDEKLFMQGMSLILEMDPEIEVVVTASNGQEFFHKLQSLDHGIDVMLLDLEMPEMDGVETLLRIIKAQHHIKVIILTSHYNDSMIIKLLDEGAAGFLAKNENPDEVIETIKQVNQKGFHINAHIMQLIRNRRLTAGRKQQFLELTSREIDVLKLICSEYTNKEIGDRLFISPRTVEGYRQSILEKTQSKNTAGIVIYAIEHQLFDVKISKYQ
jgi:DNA-binding NarL/FixJ family response regulator